MDIASIKLGDIFQPIVIGWSVGVTTLSWIFMVVAFIPSTLSGAGVVGSSGAEQSPIVVIATFIFGVPVIAALQGVLISLLCYLGICIYRKVRKL